jgi:subtilisin family serine protease
VNCHWKSITDLGYRSKLADDWFRTLESVVHPVIEENRKYDQKRVRIAILDTGVDPSHPQIRAARDANRIKAYFPHPENQDPNSSSQSFEPFRDLHGHGTHGTSVLMRTAPNAAVYIAKVDENGVLKIDQIVKVSTVFLTGRLT